MRKGTIYTFYSYKGGVGRTQALANIAVILSRWGYRVLCVDWDLEAPGLHLYFERWLKAPPSSGLVDMVHAHLRGAFYHYRDFITHVSAPQGELQLDLVLAGSESAEYVSRMQSIQWDALYQNHGFGEFLESLRATWAADYDFVLVDSRTGITDGGGICTIHLPDHLVVLSTSNKQSIEGVYEVATRARTRREGLPFDRSRLLVLPVLTRFDKRVEFSLSEEWLGMFRNRFAPFYNEWISKDAPVEELAHFTKVPYIARWSYGESLAIYEEGSRDPESIGNAFETLAAMIAHKFANTDLLIKNRDSYVAAARRLGAMKPIEGERFAFDIFFSYSRQDQAYAMSLMNIMRERGHRITGSDAEVSEKEGSKNPFSDATDTAISTSNHFVFIVGQDLSRNQLYESKLFLDATFDQSSIISSDAPVRGENRAIIPIIRRGASAEHLPYFLKSIQAVDEERHRPESIVEQIEAAIRAGGMPPELESLSHL